jgi:hypothetical protein
MTYSLRTLVCKWSGSVYDCLFLLSILMMMLWIWCYIIFISMVDMWYWRVSPEFAGHLTDWGCRWHRWTSLDSRSSKGVNCIWFGYFCLCICDIWSGVLWYCLCITDMFSLMDAGWRFLSNHTHIRRKGTMPENQRYWWRGVETSMPQPTITLIVARTIG